MAKVLITAYAMEGLSGAEEGTGLDLVTQIAKYNEVYLVTQKKNEPAIKHFLQVENLSPQGNIHFLYFDLPKLLKLLRFSADQSSTYFYLWQVCMPFWIKMKKLDLDLVHNLNLQNDWTPTFLWVLDKPLVWGPIGHRAPLTFKQVTQVGIAKWLTNRWQCYSNALARSLDPFLKMSLYRTDVILAHHQSLKAAHKRMTNKIAVMPTPIKDPILPNITVLEQNTRFVLKMYTIALNKRSWYKQLPEKQKMMHEPLLISQPYEEEFADVA